MSTEFRINGIYPDYQQINIPRNTFVAVRFNGAYEEDSINDYTIILVKQSTNEQVAVEFKHDDPHNAVIIVPIDPLEANTDYTVLVLGMTYYGVRDTVNDLTVVRHIDGTPLEESYSWSFKTNNQFDSSIPNDIVTLIIDVTTGEIVGVTGVNFDTDVDYSYLKTPAVVKAGYLSVLKTNPEDYKIDVNVTLGYIDIFLNDKLAEKHRNFLNDSASPIDTMWMVDDQNYLKSFISVKAYNAGGFNQYTVFQPKFSVGYNDHTEGVVLIRLNFSSTMRSHNKTNTAIISKGWLEYNATYIVTLRSGLDGVNTNAMEKDYQFGFTTVLHPKYSEPDAIIFELGDIGNKIPTDTINKALYRYSVLASIKFNKGQVYANPIPHYVMGWVECNAQLALIKGILGSRSLIADHRKTLDIFTIKYGPTGPLTQLKGMIDDLKECIAKNEELCANKGKKTGIKYGIRGRYEEGRPGEIWSYSRTDKYSDRNLNDPRGNDYLFDDRFDNYGKYPNMRRRSSDKRFYK